jgi:type I restriction enzyme S subunit
MSNWNSTPFATLLVDSKDGEWGDGEVTVGSRESIIIRGTDFADLDNPAVEFPKRWIKNHIADRKRLQPGDIILETAGGTSTQSTGRSALLKKSFFDHRSDFPVLCASFSRHLRLDTDKYSPRFVYYLLQTLYRTGYMAVFNIQHTGVSRFQYTAFKNHTELQIPELPVQRKISAILSAYDELIESNKCRIALLEKMAEEVYREWFVRLRFPGHEKEEFVKGRPANWDIKRVKAVVDRKRFGRIYREAELFDDGTVVVIDQSRADSLGYYDGEPQHSASPSSPIILFGDHSCKMVLMTRPFSLAENVIPIKPRAGMLPYFLFHLVKDLARTTEYKRHWTDLISREVLIPKEDLQTKFEGTVKPSHEQIELLRQSIRKVEKILNLLLPRLISGKLPVENLDIKFPPSMAEELGPELTDTAHA